MVRIAVKKIKDFGRIYPTGLLRGRVFWLPRRALCLPRLENLFKVWRAHESFKAGPMIPAGGFSPENQHGHHTEELSMASFQPLGAL